MLLGIKSPWKRRKNNGIKQWEGLFIVFWSHLLYSALGKRDGTSKVTVYPMLVWSATMVFA